MQAIDKIQPLEAMRRLLPLTNVQVYEDEMIYTLKSKVTARYFEQRAIDMILQYGLPLTATVATWERGGAVFEVNLIIAMAPDQTEA